VDGSPRQVCPLEVRADEVGVSSVAPPGWLGSGAQSTRTSAIDTDEQFGQDVDECRALHRQLPLVPRQTQLAQRADLGVRDEASTQVCLRIRASGSHPGHGHGNDLVPKWAEYAAVGLGEQYPGETFVVHQCADERLQPRLWRTTRLSRREGIHTLRHRCDRVVDHGTLKLGERCETFVEISLRQTRSEAHATDAERAGALGSGDLEGGLHQPSPSIDAAVRGAHSLEGHRHLVLHDGASLVDTCQYQSLRSQTPGKCQVGRSAAVPSTPVDARVDLSDPDLIADHLPLDEFAWLRRYEPVRWNPQPSTAGYGDAGFWMLTRHADVTAVTRSMGWSVEANSAFVRRLDESDPTGESTKDLLLCMDPPRHTRVRRVGNRCFTPRALAGLEDDLYERARRIVWAAKRNGTGDFVIDVARHLPLQAIAGLMGIPVEDRQQLFDWSDQMAGSEDPEYARTDLTGVVEMFAYAHAAAEARAENDLGDVTSRLVQPGADGQRLNSEEFAFFFMILAVAGNETTRQAITHGMLALLQHPDQWERWRSERPATAIDEILRWASPAVVLQRTAGEDSEVAGQLVRKGERVGLYFASANFDEEVFDEPRRFDIGRSPNPHVTFGAGGSHFCIGANLSRLELKVMFDVIADDLSNTKLTGPPRRLRSSWLNGIKHLPVRYGGSS
jgi:cholest-4-en-3-one 26-monooxygenase